MKGKKDMENQIENYKMIIGILNNLMWFSGIGYEDRYNIRKMIQKYENYIKQYNQEIKI